MGLPVQSAKAQGGNEAIDVAATPVEHRSQVQHLRQRMAVKTALEELCCCTSTRTASGIRHAWGNPGVAIVQFSQPLFYCPAAWRFTFGTGNTDGYRIHVTAGRIPILQQGLEHRGAPSAERIEHNALMGAPLKMPGDKRLREHGEVGAERMEAVPHGLCLARCR